MSTASAMSANGEKPKQGIECPICGCRDFRVQYTRERPGSKMRVRICRHCGHKFITMERVIGKPPQE